MRLIVTGLTVVLAAGIASAQSEAFYFHQSVTPVTVPGGTSTTYLDAIEPTGSTVQVVSTPTAASGGTVTLPRFIATTATADALLGPIVFSHLNLSANQRMVKNGLGCADITVSIEKLDANGVGTVITTGTALAQDVPQGGQSGATNFSEFAIEMEPLLDNHVDAGQGIAVSVSVTNNCTTGRVVRLALDATQALTRVDFFALNPLVGKCLDASDKELAKYLKGRLGALEKCDDAINTGGLLIIGEPVTHVIAIDTLKSERVWPQELVPRLRLLGEVFVNALVRSKSDQALRASEERLRLASSAAEAGLWMLNTETGRIWATQMVRELFDLSKNGDLTLEDFLRVIHPDDRLKVQALTGKDLETGKVDSIEYRILRPDGSVRWIASRGQSYASTTGNPTSLMGVSIDITERKAMEVRIKEQYKEINRLKLRLEEENRYLRDEVKAERGFGTIVGSSDVLQYVLFRAKQVAPTDATVLILGETGTGKGLVASAIHEMSQLHKKPMITVNCAALPGNLIESELFGREKGAFTGAHARQAGRFELADGGTIFLDEIGEMPLELQVKLLRVLQDGEFERLGGSRTIKVDVRVIAATSRDLKADIAAGRFREDLYYRLHVFPISLPPLRIRTDDIPQLAQYFIERYAKKFFKRFHTIDKETMHMLVSYRWPGNVRELEHLIERGVITSHQPEFRLVDPLENETASGMDTVPLAGFDTVARTHVLQVLEKTNWKIEGKGGAAETLGLHPSTLRFRIKKLGIKRP